MGAVQERSDHRRVTSRIVLPGEVVPEEDGWAQSTLEERIAGVWELTKLCLAWNREGEGEPRLQRSVSPDYS